MIYVSSCTSIPLLIDKEDPTGQLQNIKQ